MNYIRVKDFEKTQHYKQRTPPWFKLYWEVLQDRRLFRVKSGTKYFVIGLLALASRHENSIPFDEDWICSQLNYDEKPDWETIFNTGLIEPIDCDASALLAGCKQDAIAEKRRGEERRGEKEILSNSPKAANSSGDEFPKAEISKTQKARHLEALEIFKLWNSMPATMHHRAIASHEKAIHGAMKHNTPEEIMTAIRRYSLVRSNEDGKYRPLYAWTLSEFLTRKEGYNLERLNAENWEAPFLVLPTGNGTRGPAGDPNAAVAEFLRRNGSDEKI